MISETAANQRTQSFIRVKYLNKKRQSHLPPIVK